MRTIFFYPALIAIISGCGLGSHFFAHIFYFQKWLIVGVIFLSVLLVFIFLISKNIIAQSVVIALVLFAVSLVYGLYVGVNARDQKLLDRVHEFVDMVGVIVTDPESSGSRQRFTLHVEQIIDEEEKYAVNDNAIVSLPMYPKYTYGDRIRIASQLKLPETFDTDYGRTFPYDEFLRSQKIGYTVFADESDLISSNNGSTITSKLLHAKHTLFASLSYTMHEPFGSIARAMVFGDKSGIPKKLTNQFQTTGLIHIMVLSGYNITIIAVALLAITKRLGRVFGIIVSGISILAFLLMTGLSPTSMRAGIMGAIGLLALGTFRRSNPLRALFLAGAVMSIINPFVVLESVSFQLSFVATFGLITLTPLFTFVKIPERFGLREIIGSTIATQFAVLPLLMWKIGMVSVTGLLVNIVVVPIVPFIMLLTITASIIGLAIPFSIVGLAPELLVRGVVWVVETASIINVISFSGISAGTGFWIGLLISGGVIVTLYLLRRKGLIY